MPTTPAVTDKYMKVGLPGSATTLQGSGYDSAANGGLGSSAITVGATTNHPTDSKYVFAIDKAQIVTEGGVTKEKQIPGTYCEFEGIVSTANSIINVKRRQGNAQSYPAGALTRVYIPVSATRENDLIDGLNQDHNAKGNHKTLTDDNDNEWLERGQVTNAKNHPKVSNAVTGGAPRVDGAGDDTNVDLYFGGKGAGLAHAENPEVLFDFVYSGTGVIAISSGLIGTLSDVTYYINSKRYKKTGIANKTYTASRDTYVDIDTAGTVTYTEVANNAASPALAANSIRLGIVVTGASAISQINQGQISATLPVASSAVYTVADSLGNLICPRDPQRRLLGYKQATNFTSAGSTTDVDIAGLTGITVKVPAGRSLEVEVGSIHYSTVNGDLMRISLYEDGAGVKAYTRPINNNNYYDMTPYKFYHTPTAGSHTYKITVQRAGGTGSVRAGGGDAQTPGYAAVKLA
jgi:hypothetical protein